MLSPHARAITCGLGHVPRFDYIRALHDVCTVFSFYTRSVVVRLWLSAGFSFVLRSNPVKRTASSGVRKECTTPHVPKHRTTHSLHLCADK